MSNGKTVIIGKVEVAGLVGPLWLIGWLFTIGFTHPAFLKGVVALALWPYFLGRALS